MLDLRRIPSPLSIANIPWCLLHAGDDFTLTQLLSCQFPVTICRELYTRDHSPQMVAWDRRLATAATLPFLISYNLVVCETVTKQTSKDIPLIWESQKVSETPRISKNEEM